MKEIQFEYYNLLVLVFRNENIEIIRKIEYESQECVFGVEFDFKRVYEYEDNKQHEIMGFYHTHPKGCNFMSEVDKVSMNAWTKCLGRPLYCVIENETSDSCKNEINCWKCSKDLFVSNKIQYLNNCDLLLLRREQEKEK